eukprot:914278-Alexandrium_andersonii.AAC.1
MDPGRTRAGAPPSSQTGTPRSGPWAIATDESSTGAPRSPQTRRPRSGPQPSPAHGGPRSALRPGGLE